jgi:hypothetical protein
MADRYEDRLADYVEVSERITTFREKHPEGSFQVRFVEVPAPFNEKFIAVEARAYRTPDDERPGIDLAWEPVPGTTPYTRDSEVMNASTSAVGRAIVYALAADTHRGIASANEVRARGGGEKPKPKPLTEKQERFLGKLLNEAGAESTVVIPFLEATGQGSKAIGQLKDADEEGQQRLGKVLTERALQWEKEQGDIPPPDTTDLPPADQPEDQETLI